MLSSKLFLCADNAVVDKLTNLTSAFGIYEEITPESVPLFIPRLVVLAILEREPGDEQQHECTLNISMGEQTIFSRTVPVDFEEKLRNRTVFTMMGMPIQSIGLLHISLTCGETQLGQYEIKINEPRQTVTTSAQT